MDKKGLWVDKMRAIIVENPHPRSMTPRPIRQAEITRARRWKDLPLPTEKVVTSRHQSSHSRHRYSKVNSEIASQFYTMVMKICAQRCGDHLTYFLITLLTVTRMDGLLFPLGRDHPIGDYGFCQYTWTPTEKARFLQVGIPPRTVNDLPAQTPVLPILLYSRDLECTFRGPNLSSAYFRRLNACKEHRLVIMDLFGPDRSSFTLTFTAIPSDDICPTKRQRDLHAENLTKNRKTEFETRTPFITFMLKSGRSAGEYALGNRGPLAYDDPEYLDVWRMLQNFVGCQPFYHPPSILRNPSQYRIPLRQIHERLAREFSTSLLNVKNQAPITSRSTSH